VRTCKQGIDIRHGRRIGQAFRALHRRDIGNRVECAVTLGLDEFVKPADNGSPERDRVFTGVPAVQAVELTPYGRRCDVDQATLPQPRQKIRDASSIPSQGAGGCPSLGGKRVKP
jgi:hypothetical protein